MTVASEHKMQLSAPERYRFLDLFRGLVVVFMLEGHVVRALLHPSLTATKAFELHEIFHGITAPAFLFGSGFTLAIATQRRWELLTRWSRPLLRRLGRLVLLVILGYLLHLPYFSLRKTFQKSSPDEWTLFLAFDVLQCIGVSLLLLRLLLVLTRSERGFIYSVSALLFAIVFLTPLVWGHRVIESAPQFLAMALSGTGGSTFPLFPYAAYVFAGVLTSWRFLRSVEEGIGARFMRRLLVGGAGFILFGVSWDLVPWQVYPIDNFWHTSPAYFFIRCGVILALLSVLWHIEASVQHGQVRDVWMPRWLVTLGVESLFVYILHLIIVYGWVVNPDVSMVSRWGARLGLWESLLAFGVLTSLLAVCAIGWRFLKKEHPVLMQGMVWYLALVFVYEFVRRPY